MPVRRLRPKPAWKVVTEQTLSPTTVAVLRGLAHGVVGGAIAVTALLRTNPDASWQGVLLAFLLGYATSFAARSVEGVPDEARSLRLRRRTIDKS